MQLHFHPMSGNARRVLALAGLYQIPLDLRLVDLAAGAQRSPDYLGINPTGRVPTLVDGDVVVWESYAILRYLAEAHAPETLGADRRERAEVDRWSAWGLAHLGPALSALNAATGLLRMRGGTPDPEEVARRTEAVDRELALLERHLTGPFVAGERLTLADLVLVPILESCTWLSGHTPTDAPRVTAWLERVTGLPGWPADPRGR